jgi:ribose transport system ATP-binding protein
MTQENPLGGGSGDPSGDLVAIKGLMKAFGPVKALRSVDFTLRAGEVHALLGENGAGKSTLIKILAGVQQADGGTMEVLGQPWNARNTSESRAAGISVVYQDLSLIPDLSVAANLTLGRESLSPFRIIRRRRDERAIRAYLQGLGVDLDPRARVSTLPFAYRQMTEICKALLGDVRVLVLDEPTSALSRGEEAVLFDAVRRVTAAGVGVIYVTHRMDEVFQLSDRVTVLRDGSSVATFNTSETTMRELVSTIVGPGKSAVRDEIERETSDAAGATDVVAVSHDAALIDARPVRLELHAVGNERLNDVNLVLHQGEIHGLAGQVGSGRTEILETIFGVRHAKRGTITLDGRNEHFRRTDQAIRAGIAMVPEDRHIEGLVLDHPLDWNLTMPIVGTTNGLLPLGRAAIKTAAEAAVKRFAIRTQSVRTPASQLSGGNQQKIVFGRWSSPTPKVLLLDEPTAGVDVGSREEIYRLIHEIALSGTTVIVVSSDLVELMLISQRISIVHDGSIVQTVERGALDDSRDLHILVQESSSPMKESA